ncbi:MAG: 16S rRNA (guanine(527)-N(7))-methyltransferase RsmG [Pseudomonadota bacterium]
MPNKLSEVLHDADFDLNSLSQLLQISRETINSLTIYHETLKFWQRKINLVAPSTVDQAWHRHFLDSAQLVDALPDRPGHLIDLGSGAGFPGLVVGLLRREKFGGCDAERLTLSEADQRKAAFLKEVCRKTGLVADIDVARITYSGENNSGVKADFVSARAFAPLPKLLALAVPFFSNDTIGVFPKGRGWADEVTAASDAWAFKLERKASETDREGQILVMTELVRKA